MLLNTCKLWSTSQLTTGRWHTSATIWYSPKIWLKCLQQCQTIKKGAQYGSQAHRHTHIQPKNKQKKHITCSLINLYNLTFVILTLYFILFSACAEDFSRLLCKVSQTMVIPDYSQQENKENQVVQNFAPSYKLPQVSCKPSWRNWLTSQIKRDAPCFTGALN